MARLPSPPPPPRRISLTGRMWQHPIRPKPPAERISEDGSFSWLAIPCAVAVILLAVALVVLGRL